MEMIEPSPIDVFARLVADSGQAAELSRGETLFSEGELARSLDFLVRGAVRLSHPREGEEPLIVGLVRAGQLIEPGPFFLGERHETSANAVIPCRVIRTDRAVLESLLEEEPDLRVPILELLHDATEQSVRIARFLRTAHRIPETSGAQYEGSPPEVIVDTPALERPK